jgi:hypothetical protein
MGSAKAARTSRTFEHRDGAAAFSLERWNQNRGYMNGTPRPDTLGLVPAPRGDLPLELHGGKEYSRGAAILHQLRIELGDEVFRAGIRRYVKDHEDQTVASDDLRRSMEAEAGRSLAWFFDQWVYGAGYPVLKASWNVEGGGTVSRVRVVIEQTQAGGGGQPESFRLTVPWRMGNVTGRFDVRRRRQEFTIDVPDAKGAWLRLGHGGGTFARAETNQPWPAFIAQLDGDDDPTAQLEAIDALAAWPTRDTAMALLRRFGDAKTLPQVRAAVVRGIAPMTGADDAVAALLDKALTDMDPRVREAAAEVLGGRTRDQAGAAVAKLLADPSPYVRAAAARALGKLHVDGAFDTLRGLLVQDSHRETVRAGALDGLAALGDRRALEVGAPSSRSPVATTTACARPRSTLHRARPRRARDPRAHPRAPRRHLPPHAHVGRGGRGQAAHPPGAAAPGSHGGERSRRRREGGGEDRPRASGRRREEEVADWRYGAGADAATLRKSSGVCAAPYVTSSPVSSRPSPFGRKPVDARPCAPRRRGCALGPALEIASFANCTNTGPRLHLRDPLLRPSQTSATVAQNVASPTQNAFTFLSPSIAPRGRRSRSWSPISRQRHDTSPRFTVFVPPPRRLPGTPIVFRSFSTPRTPPRSARVGEADDRPERRLAPAARRLVEQQRPSLPRRLRSQR